MKKKLLLIVTMFVMSIVAMPNVFADDIQEVSSYNDLVAALAKDGTIKLTADIEVTGPLEVHNKVTIIGDGKKISIKESEFNPVGNNSTIITVGAGGDLIVENVNISGSNKYGLQAYKGGKLTVNNVSITNCKYGAILVNGGELIVQNLNLSDNSYGIEIGQGTGVTEEPKVILDGTISGNQKDYIYVAENDELKNFTVETTENSEDKIEIKDGKIVIIDSEGNIKVTSNNIKENVVVTGKEYQAPQKTVAEEKPSEKRESNPDTADINLLSLLALILASGLGLTYSAKKVRQN